MSLSASFPSLYALATSRKVVEDWDSKGAMGV